MKRVCIIVLLLPLAACNMDRISAENDRLRTEVYDLRDENRLLERRNSELETRLRELADATDRSPLIEAATPRLASLAIGRLTHNRDLDRDGTDDVLRIYVDPRDGFDRFLQIVGTVRIRVVRMGAAGPIETISEATFDADAVRAGYRDSIAGIHYVFEITPPAEEGMTIVLEHDDARSKRTFSTQRVFSR